MKPEQFVANFPSFPKDPVQIQKLSVFLRTKKLFTKETWDEIAKAHPDPAKLIEAIAAIDAVSPRALAEAEAGVLDIPYVDLEGAQIPNEVLKLIKLDVIEVHKIIPIQINGQDLLVGMVDPSATDVLKHLMSTSALAMRPAKILWDDLDRKLGQIKTAAAGKGAAAAPKKKKAPPRRLGDILIEMKVLDDAKLKEGLDYAKEQKLRLGAALVKKGLASNKQIGIALSRQFDIPFLDLDDSLVDPVISTLLPKKLCYEHILCPVKKEGDKIVLAMTDPTDIITIDHIQMMTGLKVAPVVSSELSILSSLDKLYGESMDMLSEKIGSDQKSADDAAFGDMGENDSAIIKLVNLIIVQAASTGTSDIHIEPFETELRVRFRKDGMMKLHMTPPKAAHPAMVSRIKIMSNLDIAELRLPQDGRIKMHLENRKLDLRVSTIPCVWGEKICMRLLDQGNLKVDLNQLGFEPHVLEKFLEGVNSPNGVVLVTGPTGSGKTTTLYSALSLLNNPSVNIMTAEDPVEYNLVGINQVQCHPDIGLDFAAALRSFLRQDPNTIMIGEIRDLETATIAIKAAMTGHLVISTLHTNDAAATVARLLNMGIHPFMLTTSVRVVQAQRLVRKICKSCYTEYKAPPDLLESLSITPILLERCRLTKEIDLSNVILAKGAGCEECEHSGYKGRQGIYEVLQMTSDFRVIVENAGSPEELRQQALKDGMLSLRESGLYKLLNKKTTVDEIFRVTLEGGEGKSGKGGGGATPAAKPTGPAAAGRPPIIAPVISTSAVTSGVFEVKGLGAMAAEMQAFRSTLERLAGLPPGGPAGGGATTTGGGLPALEALAIKSQLADPLAQIQALSVTPGSPEAAVQALPAIYSQGQKIQFNLDNLMRFLNPPLLKLKPTNLATFVEQKLIARLKSLVLLTRLLAGNTQLGKGLKITKNLPADIPPVAIDEAAMQVILDNLAVNSLTAMPAGGELKVMLRLKPQAPDRVELVLFDSGCGITDDRQKTLFTAGATGETGRLGLGLAVAKRLTEAMNGQISVRSKPGTNTLVMLEFPR